MANSFRDTSKKPTPYDGFDIHPFRERPLASGFNWGAFRALEHSGAFKRGSDIRD